MYVDLLQVFSSFIINTIAILNSGGISILKERELLFISF